MSQSDGATIRPKRAHRHFCQNGFWISLNGIYTIYPHVGQVTLAKALKFVPRYDPAPPLTEQASSYRHGRPMVGAAVLLADITFMACSPKVVRNAIYD